MNKLITSAGIILNPDKPRVGVTSKASSEFLDEAICNGIDCNYELTYEETKKQIKEENPTLDDDEIEEIARESMEMVETTGPYLVGDWIKNAEGLYEVNQNGSNGYAATVSFANGNIVCVDWSKTVKRCHYTSPCYVMSDGSGPCGDLDTEGDSVLAYALPTDCLENDYE